MNKDKILGLFFILMLTIPGSGQNATLGIGTINACYESQVSVPVYLKNVSALGALSLEITYDTTFLEFIDLGDIDDNFDAIKYNTTADPEPAILISWINNPGVDIDSVTIFYLNFNYTNSATSLLFGTNCEIANTLLDIVEVNTINGLVGPSIAISSQPVDTTIIPPDGATFLVTSIGGNQFQWQQSYDGVVFNDLEDDNIFQGTNAADLTLIETDMSLDNSYYRCLISNAHCELYSVVAALKFEGTKYQEIILKEGWTSLSSYVVPLDENIESVLESISNSLEFLFNNEGYFDPQTGTNSLGDFNSSTGYAIKLSQSDTLFMAGLKMDSTLIEIQEGWSYLPVLSECNVTVTDLFGEAISDVVIIKELAGKNVYWPEKGINILSALEPGKSYLIKTDSIIGIEFPLCEE